MKIFEGDSIKSVYKDLIDTLLSQDEMIGNTKEINNCCLIVHNPSTKNICFPYRDFSDNYLEAELKWYWSGTNSCEEIGKHAKMWLSLSDDGKTNNSAYGYIAFKKYDYNQVEQIIKLLKKDKNSRRAILNISDPTLNKIETHDLQCTIAIQFLVRNNALEETVYMRSNDVFFGLPYDYVFFIQLGEYIANSLNIPFSQYIHNATSMHMYEKDFEKFKNLKTQHFEKTCTVDVNKIKEENYEK